MAWITGTDDLPLTQQCALAGVCRSTVYARQAPAQASTEDLLLLRLIDEEYTRHPFYGSRRMTAYLRGQGHRVNRKRLQRLMRQLGLAGDGTGAEYQPSPSAG